MVDNHIQFPHVLTHKNAINWFLTSYPNTKNGSFIWKIVLNEFKRRVVTWFVLDEVINTMNLFDNLQVSVLRATHIHKPITFLVPTLGFWYLFADAEEFFPVFIRISSRLRLWIQRFVLVINFQEMIQHCCFSCRINFETHFIYTSLTIQNNCIRYSSTQHLFLLFATQKKVEEEISKTCMSISMNCTQRINFYWTFLFLFQFHNW